MVDVAGLLAPLYDCLDLASLLHIVTCVRGLETQRFFFLNFLSQILPLFEGQFNSVVQNVDIVSSNRFVPLSHLS